MRSTDQITGPTSVEPLRADRTSSAEGPAFTLCARASRITRTTALLSHRRRCPECNGGQERPHGVSRYARGCRCEVCRAGNAKQKRDWRAKNLGLSAPAAPAPSLPPEPAPIPALTAAEVEFWKERARSNCASYTPLLRDPVTRRPRVNARPRSHKAGTTAAPVTLAREPSFVLRDRLGNVVGRFGGDPEGEARARRMLDAMNACGEVTA